MGQPCWKVTKKHSQMLLAIPSWLFPSVNQERQSSSSLPTNRFDFFIMSRVVIRDSRKQVTSQGDSALHPVWQWQARHKDGETLWEYVYVWMDQDARLLMHGTVKRSHKPCPYSWRRAQHTRRAFYKSRTKWPYENFIDSTDYQQFHLAPDTLIKDATHYSQLGLLFQYKQYKWTLDSHTRT